MSRVEEVPDDLKIPVPTPGIPPTAVTQSTPFPIATDAQSQDVGSKPALPPQMASIRSHTADEIVQLMNRTPLFMTSLENAGGEEEENVELEAMRALQYEGTPAEIAQGFKEQGNSMVKVKRWKDGKEFYTKGIAVLAHERHSKGLQDGQSPGSVTMADSDEEGEIRKEKELHEACYVNRALCNLELKNYRSTTLDCASALRLNPKNVKAYYRSSSALFALDKLAEASDSCSRGLTIDPRNTALRILTKKIQTRQDNLVAAQHKKQKVAEHANQVKLMLTTALRARNIRTRNTAQPPDMEDAAIRLSPDPLSPTSTIEFPVVLLYPLHAQSDFVKAFPEIDTVPQHLDYIFPLPWDEKQEYTIGGVEFYMETGSGGLVKVGRNVSLGKVLGSGGVEVVDGIVRINVLLKGKTAGWIEEMKARKGK